MMHSFASRTKQRVLSSHVYNSQIRSPVNFLKTCIDFYFFLLGLKMHFTTITIYTYVSGGSGVSCSGDRFSGDVKKSIISVAMEEETMKIHDVIKGQHVL